MFANTLTLTINAVDKVLLRNNQDNYGSEYGFISGTETIRMLIRHDAENPASGKLLRHNVFIERTVLPTLTEVQKYYSVTFTLRHSLGSDPDLLLKLFQGASTLVATLDDGLVIGEN